MSQIDWHRAGPAQQISSQRQVAADARFEHLIEDAHRRREHLWVAIVAYLVTPPLDEGALLDADNLLNSPRVGCYVCEEPWEPRLAHRRCKGEPR